MRNRATVLYTRRQRKCRREILADDLRRADSDGPDVLLEQGTLGDPTDGLDISLDVRRVLDRLPDDLQMLAALLLRMTVTEACIAAGKSRSRIYQMIGQLRVAFIEAGLGPRPVCRR